jgi:hypothetical protein
MRPVARADPAAHGQGRGLSVRKKWRAVDMWGAAIVGALFIGAVVVLVHMSATFYAKVGVTYTVDMASGTSKQSWNTSLDKDLAGYLAVDRDAGTACELPTDPTFRGVILRGRDLHGRVLQYRVLPDHYFIEFRDHTVRCVTDSRPWGPVSAQVRENLNPTLQGLLVDAGVLAPE